MQSPREWVGLENKKSAEGKALGAHQAAKTQKAFVNGQYFAKYESRAIINLACIS